MRIAWALGMLLIAGCGLQERADFLIGRQCGAGNAEACDEGQACLPHQLEPRIGDFRCRDEDSFDPQRFGQEPPRAFCDEARGFICPGDLVCNADRIRADGGPRPLVCKRPDDVFSPPLDGGV